MTERGVSGPVVVFDGVSKRYHRGSERTNIRNALPGRRSRRAAEGGHVAVDDLSLTVDAGATIGIIGPNGAGKSTVLKLLAGVTLPSAGRISTRGRIASLIELGVGFHPDLTGAENVRFTGAVLGMDRAEIRRKYDEIVAFAGIEDAMETPVKRYSSGMLARLGFAVASHLEADILAVDEVLAVGDADFRRKSYERMRDLGESGVTIVFVSHDLWTVGQVCSRVLALEHGRLVDDGAAIEVIDRYGGSGASGGGVWGRSPVQVHDLVLDPPTIAPGGGFRVSIGLEVGAPLAGARLEVAAFTADLTPVFRRSVDAAHRAFETPGRWSVDGEVFTFPMTPGTYLVEVAVRDSASPMASRTRVTAKLEVTGPITDRPEVRIHDEWHLALRDDDPGSFPDAD